MAASGLAGAALGIGVVFGLFFGSVIPKQKCWG